MLPIKITYIISRISKSLEYEWLCNYLAKERFSLAVILLHDQKTPLEEFLISHKVPYDRIHYKNKKHIPSATWKVYRILKKEKPDIINCNLVDAQLVGLIGGWLAGVKHRIYTRHHSVFHHYYARQGLLYDKLSNKLATHIIAITGLVKKVLVEMEKVQPEKVTVIHYGFDLKEYMSVSFERKQQLKGKYQIPQFAIVIGVVSRYTHWKGLQYIIPAFSEIRKEFSNALLVLAGAGGGDMDREVRGCLRQLPKGSFREIEFENDIPGLFSCFDIFIHAPIDPWVEAFGRIYVESLASSIPSVFTMSGIAHDFIKHEENALVVNYCNKDEIAFSAIRLLKEKELKYRLIDKGRCDVNELFDIRRNIDTLQSFLETLS